MTQLFPGNIFALSLLSDRFTGDKCDRCDLVTLKVNIATGNYSVNADEIAEKILSAQVFLFDENTRF